MSFHFFLVSSTGLGPDVRHNGRHPHGSFHKLFKTHFDWSESLALSCELLKLGYYWLFRSQTTVQTIKRSLSLTIPFVLVEFVRKGKTRIVLIYKTCFEVIQFVGRRTVLSMILAWFSRKSASIRTRTSSSS